MLHDTRLEKLEMDKHSSLLDPFGPFGKLGTKWSVVNMAPGVVGANHRQELKLDLAHIF